MNQPDACSTMCFYKELLLFDVNQPAPSFTKVLVWTVVVMIYTMVIFRMSLRNDQQEEFQEAKGREFQSMYNKRIEPTELAMAEFINAGVYAPIAEELFFRLFLFKTLLIKRLKLNKHVANVIQAILFGLFHISNMLHASNEVSNVYLQTIAATIGGFISGYAYMYSNSILPSFLAHAINNTLAIHSEVTSYEEIVRNIDQIYLEQQKQSQQ